MARGKKHTAEQIVNLLRQVEVFVANGKTLPQACKEAVACPIFCTSEIVSLALW